MGTAARASVRPRARILSFNLDFLTAIRYSANGCGPCRLRRRARLAPNWKLVFLLHLEIALQLVSLSFNTSALLPTPYHHCRRRRRCGHPSY